MIKYLVLLICLHIQIFCAQAKFKTKFPQSQSQQQAAAIVQAECKRNSDQDNYNNLLFCLQEDMNYINLLTRPALADGQAESKQALEDNQDSVKDLQIQFEDDKRVIKLFPKSAIDGQCDQTKLAAQLSKLECDLATMALGKFLEYGEFANLLHLTINLPDVIVKYIRTVRYLILTLGTDLCAIFDANALTIKYIKVANVVNSNYIISQCEKYLAFVYLKSKVLKILDIASGKFIYSTDWKKNESQFIFIQNANGFTQINDNEYQFLNCDKRTISRKKFSTYYKNTHCNLSEIAIGIYMFVSDNNLIVYDFLNNKLLKQQRLDFNYELPIFMQNAIILSNPSEFLVISFVNNDFVHTMNVVSENERIKALHISENNVYIKIICTQSNKKKVKWKKYNLEKKILEDIDFHNKDASVCAIRDSIYVTNHDDIYKINDLKTGKVLYKYFNQLDEGVLICRNKRLVLGYANMLKIFILPDEYENFTFEQKLLLHDIGMARKHFKGEKLTLNSQQQQVLNTFDPICKQMILNNTKESLTLFDLNKPQQGN